MTANAAPLGLRLFLEGIEVPAISAQVSIAQDQAVTAAIQIVPGDYALHLLPRTSIHLFYLAPDSDLKMVAELEAKAQASGDQNYRDLRKALDSKYRLLFCGELVGTSYSKNPVARQLVLQCMDLSLYWDTCYQWFADYSAGGGALTDKQHNFVNSGREGVFDNIAGGHKWVIGRILAGTPQTPEYKNARGLLGSVIHLLEAIGGVRYRGADFLGYRGVNDFFTLSELRYNLTGMIGAVEGDTTSEKLYNRKAFNDWLRNGMTSMGNLVSFRDVLNHVNSHIFHNVYPNPCARYVKGDFKSVPVFRNLYSTSGGAAAKKLIGSAFVAAREADVLRDAEPDSPDVLVKLADALTWTTQALAYVAKEKKASDYAFVFGKVNSAKANLTTAIANQGKTNVSEAVQDLISAKTGSPNKGSAVGTAQISVGEHLFTHLILPEIFFAAPPRCNVVFPDQYYSFQYNRNFLREVTRLSLQGGIGIAGQNLKMAGRHYFAPDTKGVAHGKGGTLYATLGYGGRVILPHEVHSGVIPKFEWVSDGHRWSSKADKAGGNTSPNGTSVPYLQRLANYNLFLNRWSSRSMSVSGVFNPNLVVGLPGVVIDRSSPAPHIIKSVQGTLGIDLTPVQYLGKIQALTHSVSQEGGMTSVSYGFCRTHKGLDDEFLGILTKEATTTISTDVVVAPNDVFTIPSSGPGTMEQVVLLAAYMRGTAKPGVPVPGVMKGALLTEVKESKDSLKVGPSVYSAVIDPESVLPTLKVSGTDDVTLPAELCFTFEDRVGTGVMVTSTTPVEDYMMPGWYDDTWGRKNISDKAYYPLLGTLAITDDTTIAPSDLDPTFTAAVIPKSNSIQEAIDSLTLTYSTLKAAAGSIHEFIQQYTYRPIATLQDVLGSSDLEWTDLGMPKDPNMVEGFHSRAHGDYNTDVKFGATPVAGDGALFLLYKGVPKASCANIRMPSLTETGELPSPVSPELDPRGRARLRVKAYVQELQASRGLLGG